MTVVSEKARLKIRKNPSAKRDVFYLNRTEKFQKSISSNRFQFSNYRKWIDKNWNEK